MIIDIVNNADIFFKLQKYNNNILNFSKLWGYNKSGGEYDFNNRVISSWFDPLRVRKLGLSRTYPHMDNCQYRLQYCLYIHCSNYLFIFLINKLYDKRNVLIEDVGGGMGVLFFYLNKLGFDNFHLWDNFSQLSELTAKEFIETFNLNCQINNTDLKPVISNNVGVPAIFVRKIQPELELFTFYTNRDLEKKAKRELSNSNFKFLCKDSDDLAVAYCRKDKYEMFKSKLSKYEIKYE